MAEVPATTGTAPGNGWAKVWGFLDGVGGATSRIGGIVDTVADGAEDVARGRAAISNQRLDVQERELDLALRLSTTERGDNVQLYYAAAFGAAVLLFALWR